MTCDITDMPNRVQQHPCTDEATDRNWDWTKKQFDIFAANIRSLQDCFEEPIVTAVGLRRFKLTADLALNGSAAALLQKWVGGAWTDDPDGNPIVVKDVNGAPGFWMGLIGWGGWCLPEPGSSTNYHIVWMETMAKVIRYELTATLTGASATATVLHYANGKDPGATVSVYDPNGMYAYWHQYGCKGVAWWVDRNNRYEIVTPQMVAKFLYGTIDQSQCCIPGESPPDDPPCEPTDPLTMTTSTLTGAYKQALYCKHPRDIAAPYAEKTQVPISNQTEHVWNGNAKAVVVGRYDSVANDIVYNVIDVERKRVDVMVELEQDNSCTFKITRQRIYVETCGQTDEESGVDLGFEQVDVLTEASLDYTASPESCKINLIWRPVCVLQPQSPYATSIDFTPQEVLTDWYVAADGSDYKIYGTTMYVWVPCVSAGSDVALHTLLRRDIITEFETTHVTDPPQCDIDAHTEKMYVFRVPDPAEAGDDIPVASMTRREVLIDATVDATDGLQVYTEYVFVLCWDTGNTVQIIEATECQE